MNISINYAVSPNGQALEFNAQSRKDIPIALETHQLSSDKISKPEISLNKENFRNLCIGLARGGEVSLAATNKIIIDVLKFIQRVIELSPNKDEISFGAAPLDYFRTVVSDHQYTEAHQSLSASVDFPEGEKVLVVRDVQSSNGPEGMMLHEDERIFVDQQSGMVLRFSSYESGFGIKLGFLDDATTKKTFQPGVRWSSTGDKVIVGMNNDPASHEEIPFDDYMHFVVRKTDTSSDRFSLKRFLIHVGDSTISSPAKDYNDQFLPVIQAVLDHTTFSQLKEYPILG